jgi:hypothetical protein
VRRFFIFLVTGLLTAGCVSNGNIATVPGESSMPTAPVASPGNTAAPQETATTLPRLTEPSVTVNQADLAPYFATAHASLDGVFMVQGADLTYARGETRAHVLSGPHPRALAAGVKGALVTEGTSMFWYDPKSGVLTEIPGLPAAQRVAFHGDTYLIATWKDVYRWSPDTPLVKLSAPDHVYAVYGVSLSPDGQYGAAAYDLDIPQGPRAGVLRIYDLETGRDQQWPAEQPKVMSGLWLLGWSEQNTVRYMTGVRGFNIGHTWALPDDAPGERDGTEYRMMEDAWISPDGGWIIYRPAIQEVAVQSVQPGSKPIAVYRDRAGLDDARMLLNGNLAFRTRYPATWWEITPEGKAIRWDQADALY